MFFLPKAAPILIRQRTRRKLEDKEIKKIPSGDIILQLQSVSSPFNNAIPFCLPNVIL